MYTACVLLCIQNVFFLYIAVKRVLEYVLEYMDNARTLATGSLWPSNRLAMAFKAPSSLHCMYVCVYIYVYVCVYIYTYMYSGLPYATINLQSGHGTTPGWTGGSAILAEVGTI